MKSKLLASLLCIALIGSACSEKGNHSVDADGNCTEAFIHDYNSLTKKRTNLVNAVNDEDMIERIKSIVTACTNLTSVHGKDTTCKAEVNNQVEAVSTSDHKAGCDLASKILTGYTEE